MDPRFQAYGQTVCTFLRHATDEEKQSVRQELSAHMEDHAQALLDAGYGEADAHQIALDAMGDPEEVGKELNKEFPLRWLILSRMAAAVLVLLVLSLLLTSPFLLSKLEHNLYARFSPMSLSEGEEIPNLTQVDIRQDFPGGNVFYIYGVSLTPAGDTYTVRVCSVIYHKNPVQSITGMDYPFTLSSPGVTKESYLSTHLHVLQGVAYGQPVTLHYDNYGMTFDLDIPIPWEEAME